jgi:predicted methyltransferase
MKPISLFIAAATLVCCNTAAVAASPQIEAAIANPARTAEARAMDASRKPAEVLDFLGFAPGMAAADLMTGSGYWAEIMDDAAAPEGKVTALEPKQFYTAPDEVKVWDALVARRPRVEFVRYPFEALAMREAAYDFAMINLSYHDLYWESEKYKIPRTDPAAFLATLNKGMKPGGIVGVIDHVGPAGDTRAIVEKLHRIDPATVRADFERAGFVLEAESPLLRNPEDDGTKMVYDPAVRGKTDRIVYRFRKPG